MANVINVKLAAANGAKAIVSIGDDFLTLIHPAKHVSVYCNYVSVNKKIVNTKYKRRSEDKLDCPEG